MPRCTKTNNLEPVGINIPIPTAIVAQGNLNPTHLSRLSHPLLTIRQEERLARPRGLGERIQVRLRAAVGLPGGFDADLAPLVIDMIMKNPLESAKAGLVVVA